MRLSVYFEERTFEARQLPPTCSQKLVAEAAGGTGSDRVLDFTGAEWNAGGEGNRKAGRFVTAAGIPEEIAVTRSNLVLECP